MVLQDEEQRQAVSSPPPLLDLPPQIHTSATNKMAVLWNISMFLKVLWPSPQAQAAGASQASSPCRPSPSGVRPAGAASPHAHAYPPQDSLAGVGGDVQEAFSQGEDESKPGETALMLIPHVATDGWSQFVFFLSRFLFSGSRRNLRNDLMVAADSITNTVSSLVKELHSGKAQTDS